jgi:hemoglobin
MKDIETIDDIKLFVNTFYEKVRTNELIGPVFNAVIGDKWPIHLEKMYTFWQTILFNDRTYFGRPFPPHAKLPISAEHFETWKELFNETVNQNFEGPVADDAMWRANQMAQMFQSKIEYIKSHPNRESL